MARARNLKPDFFVNERLGECHPLARILFAGLWTIADREGRLEDRPKRIKVSLLPYDECDTDELLEQLAQHGLIVRYEAGGRKCICIPGFLRHQNPHKQEKPSELPEWDGSSPVFSGQVRNKTGSAPASSLFPLPSSLDPESPFLNPPSLEEEASASSCSEAHVVRSEPNVPNPLEPVVLEFPVKGNPSKPTWSFVQSHLERLERAFPDLDIVSQAKQALEWTFANPGKQKTASGMPKFLLGWMQTAQNSGRARAGPIPGLTQKNSNTVVSGERWESIMKGKA